MKNGIERSCGPVAQEVNQCIFGCREELQEAKAFPIQYQVSCKCPFNEFWDCSARILNSPIGPIGSSWLHLRHSSSLISLSPFAPQPSRRRGRGSSKDTWHKSAVAFRYFRCRWSNFVYFVVLESQQYWPVVCLERQEDQQASSTMIFLEHSSNAWGMCGFPASTALQTSQQHKSSVVSQRMHSYWYMLLASLSLSAFSPKGGCPQSNLQTKEKQNFLQSKSLKNEWNSRHPKLQTMINMQAVLKKKYSKCPNLGLRMLSGAADLLALLYELLECE